MQRNSVQLLYRVLPTVLFLLPGLSALAAAPAREPYRIGLSVSMFGRINENDAKASIAALTSEIAREHEVPVSPVPRLYTSIDSITQAYRNRTVDAVILTLPEYWAMHQNFNFVQFVGSIYDQGATENYLLLTRVADGFNDLASLRGRRLSVNLSARMSLAATWLDVELRKAGLPPTAEHFGKLQESAKPNKAVLDLYFGRTDACIISRRIFATVVELNPALAKSLRTLKSSPGYVPAMLALTDQTSPELRALTISELGKLHETQPGRQVLTMLHMVRTGEITAESFQSSLNLLDEHARLCPSAAAARTAALQDQRLPSENLE